jgi:hypothetical protein
VEKFRAWSDCDGDVERCFSKLEEPELLIEDVRAFFRPFRALSGPQAG